jgi:hypothetical protein
MLCWWDVSCGTELHSGYYSTQLGSVVPPLDAPEHKFHRIVCTIVTDMVSDDISVNFIVYI